MTKSFVRGEGTWRAFAGHSEHRKELEELISSTHQMNTIWQYSENMSRHDEIMLVIDELLVCLAVGTPASSTSDAVSISAQCSTLVWDEILLV